MNTESLQGYGTYTYDCRKQDCWHCDVMGLKPLPEIIEHVQQERIVLRTFNKKKYRESLILVRWTKEEDELIINNIWMNTAEMKKLFPKRTRSAIACRISKLRYIGKMIA